MVPKGTILYYNYLIIDDKSLFKRKINSKLRRRIIYVNKI